MSEHGDLWPGPRRAHGAAGEPEQPLGPDAGAVTPDDGVSASASASVSAPASAELAPEPERTEDAPSAEDAPSGEDAPAAEDESPAASTRSAARTGATRPADGRRIGAPVLIWSLVGAVVLIAVAVTAYLLLRDDGSQAAPAPAPTVTTTLPAPTPAAAPIERGEGSALFTALPGEVRQYVLTSITPVGPAVPGGALETYDVTYEGDLAGAGAAYTVHVEQWATPELATAAAEAAAAPLAPASSTGEVLVADAATGTFSLFGEDGAATETGAAVWTNSTLVLQASGPALDIRNFYLAFGL